MGNVIIFKTTVTMLLLIAGFGISLWVVLSDKKSTSNKLLFITINLILAFILVDYIANFTSTEITTFLLRLDYALSLVASIFLYLFVDNFPYKSKTNKPLAYSMVIYLILMALITLLSPYVILASYSSGLAKVVSAGSVIWMYYLSIASAIILVFFTVIGKYLRSSKLDKSKIRLMILGMILFTSSEVLFAMVLPTLGVDNLVYIGDYSILIFIGLTAYAIVKHGLFDVRLAIVRSVTYTLLVGSLAGIYAAVTFGISSVFNLEQSSSPWQIALNISTSLLLVFLFQPLKRFFDKFTNRVFYKDNYNTDDFFGRLNKTLSVTTDLRGLLERTAYEIGTTLKAEQTFFFIYTTAEGNYVTAGTERHKLLPKVDAVQIEQKFGGKDDVVVASLLNSDDPIKRTMISHRIEIILPLIQDGEVIGFLCLGEHKTSGYTNRDIKALETISDELIIAVQNALAVHEIREINATLQQRIANATKELRSKNATLSQLDKIKDEFISMASHQLRTPLTSVKGYLSMVIEGDVGKITPTQKKLLDQAFLSSENMVHLINDFLNVSRIQSGKFVIDNTTVNMADLVEQEVNSLRPNAEARGMKLVYKKPKNFPTTEVDEGKIRQVVMNFSDNAIYYSHENSSINIDLTIEGKEIVFKVRDTGIGVPKHEREQLFSKFYRASNAKVQRPDGTGVGIYLAKKVIDASGGKIIFESIEGKGSTFGFRLPIVTAPITPDESK